MTAITPAAPTPASINTLREDRDRFVALAFSWADVLLELDADARIVYAAGAVEVLAGRSARSLIGTTEQVIVEGYSEETELLLKGRSSRQAPDIDGQVYITSGTADIGDIITLKITDSSDYDLIGEMVE